MSPLLFELNDHAVKFGLLCSADDHSLDVVTMSGPLD
jgi:hypothetical protein